MASPAAAAQQLEFHRSKIQVLAILGGGVFQTVDDDGSAFQMVDVCIATACATGGTVFGGRLGDAEACMDTRQQFGHFEGLGHVVVGPGFQAGHDVKCV